MLKRLFNRTPKTYQVSIEPFAQTVTVGARETILHAALEAGLAYPYECQTGACSTCKTQVIEGEIKALTDFAYVLEMDEIRGGTILACQSLAASDLKIRVHTLDDGLPSIPSREYKGTISEMTPLTRDIIDVRISLDERLNFYAGQYANLSIPNVVSNRPYSFATAPGTNGQTELSFHVRLVTDGELSGWLASADRVGESINVDGPYGIFRMRETDVPVLCIAGGSGMAPIKAMLEQAIAEGRCRPVVYLYGGRTQADLYDSALIKALTTDWSAPIRFIPVLSEEPTGSSWQGARGFVTDFINTIDDFDLAGCQAYLCGPPVMIDAALPILSNAGVRGRDIYFDKFTDRSMQK
ncbi:MAG: NAD(P)H-flavin reductase/ferredoxin [Gammaproteobacteria bacterium]|jgi:NAD(P)H-flavin reductase/ferredoxin